MACGGVAYRPYRPVPPHPSGRYGVLPGAGAPYWPVTPQGCGSVGADWPSRQTAWYGARNGRTSSRHDTWTIPPAVLRPGVTCGEALSLLLHRCQRTASSSSKPLVARFLTSNTVNDSLTDTRALCSHSVPTIVALCPLPEQPNGLMEDMHPSQSPTYLPR